MLYTNFQPSDPCAAASENISFDFGHFAGKSLYEIGENGNFGEKFKQQKNGNQWTTKQPWNPPKPDCSLLGTDFFQSKSDVIYSF